MSSFVPEVVRDRVFLMGPSLLHMLGRIDTSPNRYHFVLFTDYEDYDDFLDLFHITEDMFEENDVYPLTYECLGELYFAQHVSLLLSRRYSCVVLDDVYSDFPIHAMDVTIKSIRDNYLFHGYECNTVLFEFPTQSADILFTVANGTRRMLPSHDTCRLLSIHVTNAFRLEALNTFARLDDLVNRVSIDRLPIYSNECCSFEARNCTALEPDGRLRLTVPTSRFRDLSDGNFLDCFYYLDGLKHYTFDAVLTKQSPCRGEFLRDRYFYRWLRFAWRSNARGRCARRVRRCFDRWRHNLYVPRFETSRVQREWKLRFESNRRKMCK